MTRLRPLGHYPDRPDIRDRIMVGYGKTPSEYSLAHLVKRVGPLFQVRAGTCVAQVLAQAMRVVWENRHRLGKATPVPARRGVYYAARSLSGDQHLDDGCQPRFAMSSLNDMGFTLESGPDALPYDEEKINDPIPVSSFHGMADQVGVLQYRRIIEGPSAVDLMKQALYEQQRPIPLAIQVVTSFDEYEGGVWMPKDSERSRGGHYILVIGYSDEKGAFLFTNSWEGFGIVEEGCSFGWMSYDMIERRKVSDVYVVYPSALPSSIIEGIQ